MTLGIELNWKPSFKQLATYFIFSASLGTMWLLYILPFIGHNSATWVKEAPWRYYASYMAGNYALFILQTFSRPMLARKAFVEGLRQIKMDRRRTSSAKHSLKLAILLALFRRETIVVISSLVLIVPLVHRIKVGGPLFSSSKSSSSVHRM